MTEGLLKIIEKLEKSHSLELEEYEELVKSFDSESSSLLRKKAAFIRNKIYGKQVFIRGLIEFSNYCKNDCFYCGIRFSNRNVRRYRLSNEEIFQCVEEGYRLGFRTFVLQSGEDPFFTDEKLLPLISGIKNAHPDSALTLSIGERSLASYRLLHEAGADRYLLRHESASSEHYARLHPEKQTYSGRMKALENLRQAGFTVGAGFMVSSPYQTLENLARDLKFIEEFQPEMCGIGPFIPHKDTPFAEFPAGGAELTCYLLSIIRLIKPNILLPATTALGSIENNGREEGILSGANVIMPNLSPFSVRKDYSLYEGKLFSGAESAQSLEELKKSIAKTGYEIVVDRGDIRPLEQ